MQQNKTPDTFKNFFITNQSVCQHNNRQNHNLHINQPNTKNSKGSIKYHMEIFTWYDTQHREQQNFRLSIKSLLAN